MDLLVKDLSDPPVDGEETRVTPFESDLTKVRDQVRELLNLSLLEYKRRLKEIVKKMTKGICDDMMYRQEERELEAQIREDRMEEDIFELEGWLKSLVTEWKRPANEVSEDPAVNGEMYRDLRRDLGNTLVNMESRSRNDMFKRQIKAGKDEQIFMRNIKESIEVLETSYIDMTADISKRLDDMWTKFNVPNLNTSGGPLEKNTAPQTSRNLSVINASSRDSDLKKDKSPSAISRLLSKTKKLMKIKTRDKACVSPITQQNEHDADEVQAERKQQERVRMFRVTDSSGERSGPLDKVTTPQTSSKPSVSKTTSRECNWGFHLPSKPQWDFKRANFLPDFIRIRKKTKVKAFGRARVSTITQQNEHDADEVQTERKLQESIKMFQVTGTSGRQSGPLHKATTTPTSSKPSVSTAIPRECNWGFDHPNKPQWDFERANFPPPIIRIRKKMKVKACEKACVMPVIQQNKHDADEVQAERKLQERVKMFRVTDTSGGRSGPLDKATTPQTSSKPSVSTAIPRECNWVLEPSTKPQWDFKRANILPPIIRICEKTKVKAFGKACVSPITQQSEHDAVEVQTEKFEVKTEDEKTAEGEVQEKKAQRKWKIFSRLLSKCRRTASKPAGLSDRVVSNTNPSASTSLCI